MAPHILTIDAPTVEPIGPPSGDFEHIPSSPEMFGGLRAKAEEQFGGGLEHGADAAISYLDEVNKFNDQTHASELHSWGTDQAGDLVSKHSELTGRAAADALPQLKEQLRQIQQDADDQAGKLYTKSLVSQSLKALSIARERGLIPVDCESDQ
jgi:hypothetical protein